MNKVDIIQQPSGKFIARIDIHHQTSYGEGNTIGEALVELGFYLDSIKPKDPIQTLLEVLIR